MAKRVRMKDSNSAPYQRAGVRGPPAVGCRRNRTGENDPARHSYLFITPVSPPRLGRPFSALTHYGKKT